MTPLAPPLTGYLRDCMPRQRGDSPRSCETYAYGFDCCLPSLPNASARSHHSCMSSSSMRS